MEKVMELYKGNIKVERTADASSVFTLILFKKLINISQ